MTDQALPDPSVPPPPQAPDPNECCGRGCDPCIHDYYEAALERWKEQVKLLRGEGAAPTTSRRL